LSHHNSDSTSDFERDPGECSTELISDYNTCSNEISGPKKRKISIAEFAAICSWRDQDNSKLMLHMLFSRGDDTRATREVSLPPGTILHRIKSKNACYEHEEEYNRQAIALKPAVLRHQETLASLRLIAQLLANVISKDNK